MSKGLSFIIYCPMDAKLVLKEQCNVRMRKMQYATLKMSNNFIYNLFMGVVNISINFETTGSAKNKLAFIPLESESRNSLKG